MKPRRNGRHLPAATILSAAVAGGLLVDAQALEPARQLLQLVAPPAIDRGVDRTGLPRPPRRRRIEAGDGPERAYVPGRVIVKFKDGGGAASRAAAEAGGRAMHRPAHADFDVMDIDPSLDAEAVAADLAARDDVEYAQASYIVHPYFRPNDPLFSQQWNLSLLGMEQAWEINRGASSTVVVAVLDTGVAFQNAIEQFIGFPVNLGGVRYPALGRVTVPFAAAPELAGPSRFAAPYDFIWNDTLPFDMDGHGTHVAGTIGQLTDNTVGVAGMAFNVRIMPVKVIASDWDDIFNSPEVGTDDVLARGIRYAADNGARVINMSLGRDGPPAPVVGDALRYAVGRGAFVAVAAGNDYERGNPVEAIAQQAGPIDGAMVVSAVGSDSLRAYYSGVRSYVEIAAPGGNSRIGGVSGLVLQQTYDAAFADLPPPSSFGTPRFDVFAYRAFQGTSMSTAHVSGLAALLASQGITSPAAIEAAIKRFAIDRGPTGRDDEYGAGLIGPRATLRGLGLLK
jgi:serine protease